MNRKRPTPEEAKRILRLKNECLKVVYTAIGIVPEKEKDGDIKPITKERMSEAMGELIIATAAVAQILGLSAEFVGERMVESWPMAQGLAEHLSVPMPPTRGNA